MSPSRIFDRLLLVWADDFVFAYSDSDFLSSIELLIVDQADVMLMQNWEHVQFVMQRLDKIPTNTRDTDFSRVKPWYLEDKSVDPS